MKTNRIFNKGLDIRENNQSVTGYKNSLSEMAQIINHVIFKVYWARYLQI